MAAINAQMFRAPRVARSQWASRRLWSSRPRSERRLWSDRTIMIYSVVIKFNEPVVTKINKNTRIVQGLRGTVERPVQSAPGGITEATRGHL